jgi:hypothetical protein
LVGMDRWLLVGSTFRLKLGRNGSAIRLKP